MNSEDVALGMYADGGPSGSTLMARRSSQVVAREMEKLGGKMHIAHCRPVFSRSGALAGIEPQDGKTLTAGHYVFACGLWLPKLFPNLLGNRLKVQRRDVLFYGVPAGNPEFSYPNFPNWSVLGSGWYGFPDIEDRGLKAAPYPDYNSIDPDFDERIVSAGQFKRGRDFLKHRFPSLGDMPVVETRVCQVTNSTDENFVMDRHPEADNMWIVGGGSGHGFKHGPTVGEILSQKVLGEPVDDVFTNTFSLKSELFD